MLKRLLTGIVLMAILIPVLIFSDTLVTPVVFALIAVVSLTEMAKCVKMDGRSDLSITLPAYIIAAILPFYQYYFGKNTAALIFSAAAFLVFIIFALRMFGVIKNSAESVTQFLMVLIYVSGASVTAVAIAKAEHGGFVLPLIFLGSWGSDTFAYLCGTFFGRHKLIPKVSPKKTVEGSVGAVIFTVLFFILYGFIVSSVTNITSHYYALAIAGFSLSVLSQIGDLNASFIKRTYGVKDYGNIFPGHGGMLDRFDSVIAITPILYVISIFVTYFS